MKILVVDDSSWQRSMLRKVLGGAGCSVVDAANGNEAVAKVDAESPDVIVCDLLMPELDGFGFLGLLKERGLSIPVVIASADIQKATREKCEELGAFGFVGKPYTPDQLLKVVAAAAQSVGKGDPQLASGC